MPVRKRKRAALAYDPREHGITQSLLFRYLECRTMAKQTVKGWTGTGFESATIQGDLTHRALELLYNSGVPPWSMDDVDKALETARHEIAQHAGRGWTADSWTKWELMPYQLRPVLFGYGHYWADADAEADWLETEGSFGVNVPAVHDVIVRGKRDAVVVKPDRRRKSGGTVWLFETKTRGEISESNLLLSLHRDLQVNVYLWALNAVRPEGYEDQPPSGAFYNVVRRTRLRLKTKESEDEYEARIAADILERPDHYYKRFEVSVTPDELEEFERAFYRLLVEFYQWWQNKMPGMIYAMPCVNKYGPCAYIQLCHEGSSSGLRMRRTMFEEL